MTIDYRFEQGACVPLRVHTVVVSIQHSPEIDLAEVRRLVREEVIGEVIPPELLNEETVYQINSCGTFITGGPMVRVYKLHTVRRNFPSPIEFFLTLGVPKRFVCNVL